MNRRAAYTALLSTLSVAAVSVSPAHANAPADPLHDRSTDEINAGVEPTDTAYAYPDARRYGVSGDGSDQTEALQRALSVAKQPVSRQLGAELILPQGLIVLGSMIAIPNRVRVRGANKRGTVLRAAPGHPGPYMFFANNGTSSMFDCALEELTLDCNDVDGLGGVLSDAWQEGGGLYHVLIQKFRTHGVKLQTGYGGATLVVIKECEMFASTHGATSGIEVAKISAVGTFMLHVNDTSITGPSPGKILPKGINVVSDSLTCQNVHFENCTDGVFLSGVGSSSLNNLTGNGNAPAMINLVHLAPDFAGNLKLENCRRAGARYLLTNEARIYQGGILSALAETIDSDLPQYEFSAAAPAYNAGIPINNIGVAKVLSVFNGDGSSGVVPNTSIAMAANVRSIVKHATGDYTLTFHSPLNNASPVVIISTNLPGADNPCSEVTSTSRDNVRFRIYRASALHDASNIMVAVFGV
jgi:hypothetical protein